MDVQPHRVRGNPDGQTKKNAMKWMGKPVNRLTPLFFLGNNLRASPFFFKNIFCLCKIFSVQRRLNFEELRFRRQESYTNFSWSFAQKDGFCSAKTAKGWTYKIFSRWKGLSYLVDSFHEFFSEEPSTTWRKSTKLSGHKKKSPVSSKRCPKNAKLTVEHVCICTCDTSWTSGYI